MLDFIKRLFGIKNSGASKEGTVKFYNYKKGFGFITVKDSNEEIFVHSTGLIDKIKENHKVTFQVEKGDKGLNAVNVKRVK